MYVLCKEGFVSTVLWNGKRVIDVAQQRAIEAASRRREPIVVVRSRHPDTLPALFRHLGRDVPTFSTEPPSDYPYRAYLARSEWAELLVGMANQLDYDNVKDWFDRENPAQAELAHAIWEATVDAAAGRTQRFSWEEGDLKLV